MMFLSAFIPPPLRPISAFARQIPLRYGRALSGSDSGQDCLDWLLYSPSEYTRDSRWPTSNDHQIMMDWNIRTGMRLILKSCSGYKSSQDSDDFRKYADQCFLNTPKNVRLRRAKNTIFERFIASLPPPPTTNRSSEG